MKHYIKDKVGSGEHLRTDEVAACYKIHPETVRRMVRERRIHAIKVGRNWRVPKSELDRIGKAGGI